MVINFIFLCMLNLVEYSLPKKSRGTIVGGEVAGSHDFPYAAFMAVHCETENPDDYDQYGYWVCGSSIINQRTLLTAGHCLSCYKIELLIKVGHANKNNGTTIPTLEFKIHEEYDDAELYNDIGIVILKTDLELGENVRRVILTKEPPPSDVGIVCGWGLSHELAHHIEDVLKYVTQQIISNVDCLSVLETKPIGTLCAHSINDDGYAFLGDSGGPLVVNDYIQVGIVSYREPSIRLSLTVYTSISHFIGWIRKTVFSSLCKIPESK